MQLRGISTFMAEMLEALPSHSCSKSAIHHTETLCICHKPSFYACLRSISLCVFNIKPLSSTFVAPYLTSDLPFDYLESHRRRPAS